MRSYEVSEYLNLTDTYYSEDTYLIVRIKDDVSDFRVRNRATHVKFAQSGVKKHYTTMQAESFRFHVAIIANAMKICTVVQTDTKTEEEEEDWDL
ncbi:hypothetical protein Bhyg_04251 [Pseudolycoriella hygida]|uniref:Uncharacterized protein n=1 Tax=Pseudolycoriella hygida TaxID=35572 RepID=A0A9Q0NEU3_9DIPT|nr:hypothetical protein Bhyg_04251 [Pseudolycoriella hygida]